MDRDGDLHLLWLFIPSETGLRILGGLDGAVSKRTKRERARKEANTKPSASEVLARSGAWLFQRKTRDESINDIMHIFGGCGAQCSTCKTLREEEDEQCLRGIMALFPSVEEGESLEHPEDEGGESRKYLTEYATSLAQVIPVVAEPYAEAW